MFQAKLINYSLQELYRESRSLKNSFKTRLKCLDEIYKRSPEETIRMKRYLLLQEQFDTFSLVVPLSLYQDKDFFESEQRVFFEKNISLILEIKAKHREKTFNEITNYCREIENKKIIFINGLTAIYKNLKDSSFPPITDKQLGLGLFNAFDHLEALRIAIMQMEPVYSVAVEFNTQTNHLIDLINRIYENGNFMYVLASSRVMNEKKFQHILKIEALKEILTIRFPNFNAAYLLN